jgi:hypothetical protein
MFFELSEIALEEDDVLCIRPNRCSCAVCRQQAKALLRNRGQRTSWRSCSRSESGAYRDISLTWLSKRTEVRHGESVLRGIRSKMSEVGLLLSQHCEALLSTYHGGLLAAL